MKEERKGALSTIFQWVVVFAAAVVASFLIRSFLIEFYAVPSGSMLQTIQEGDRVVGEKLSFRFREPHAGEIITFDDPSGSGNTLIKRVIATGGQTVDLRDGVVYVDETALEEPCTNGLRSDPLQDCIVPGGISYPYTVPDDCLWVMGDNRTNSRDSRYFGPVPLDSVTSRAVWTYWPLSSWGGI
jgi:signal peptidase I